MMWNFPSFLVSWPIRECRFCLFHSSPILRTAIPVYVFVPDSVRTLELEVSLVSVPVPEITPVCSVWFDDDEYTNAELFVIAAE